MRLLCVLASGGPYTPSYTAARFSPTRTIGKGVSKDCMRQARYELTILKDIVFDALVVEIEVVVLVVDYWTKRRIRFAVVAYLYAQCAVL